MKRFGGAQALMGIEITVEAGEVHGLVGENGAGKSTLGKCIAGVVHPDEGELLVDGAPVDYRVPRDALNDGITIVEQELALVPAMSVADNVLLGGRALAGAEGPGRRAARAQVRRLNEEFSLGLDVDATVEGLPVADQQKVEILRGLALGARLIVMDEPTARLARDEADNLLRIIRLIADQGTSVVFVSHFLQDVLRVSDRVTVMRNGEVVHTVRADQETPDSLVSAMLGRAASLEFPQKRPVPAGVEPILVVRNLADRRLVNNVSFTVRPGEIVGLGGLVGSGRSEVARLIFGAAKPLAGSIEFDGKPTRFPSVRAAVRRGIAYLPEDRKDLGLLLNLTNRENTTLAHLGEVSRVGLISRSKERRASAEVLARLGVTPPDPALRVGTLSGGNQQKVLFGKWLWQTPRLLIADEPTRGVDVGAKFAIYDLLVGLASEGMAILLISSEIEELVGLSHRVVVMARGCTVAELREEDVQEDKILHAAFDSVDPRLSEASA
ncbi:MAG: sugar ABC transporter ATP-binding protein [Solirubrobacterales bacterium]